MKKRIPTYIQMILSGFGATIAIGGLTNNNWKLTVLGAMMNLAAYGWLFGAHWYKMRQLRRMHEKRSRELDAWFYLSLESLSGLEGMMRNGRHERNTK